MDRNSVIRIVGQMNQMAALMQSEYNEYRRQKSDWYDILVTRREEGSVTAEEFNRMWDLYHEKGTCSFIDEKIEQLRKASANLVAEYDHFLEVREEVKELLKDIKGGK